MTINAEKKKNVNEWNFPTLTLGAFQNIYPQQLNREEKHRKAVENDIKTSIEIKLIFLYALTKTFAIV